MTNLHTKLNELNHVIDITKDKLKSKKISIEDAQYVLLVINKYLDTIEN